MNKYNFLLFCGICVAMSTPWLMMLLDLLNGKPFKLMFQNYYRVPLPNSQLAGFIALCIGLALIYVGSCKREPILHKKPRGTTRK